MTTKYPASLTLRIARLRAKQEEEKKIQSLQHDPKLKKAEAIYRTLCDMQNVPQAKERSYIEKRLDIAFQIMKDSGYSLSTKEISEMVGIHQQHVSEAFNKAGISTTFLIGSNQ